MTEIKWKPTRDGYGDALVEMGAQDERIVVLGADLSDSTRALWFWTTTACRLMAGWKT